VFTNFGGGLNGTGVPFTFKKWNTDQPITEIPRAMAGTDTGSLTVSGRRPGKPNSLSTRIAKSTKRVEKTPKINNPTGVSKFLVFLVPVADL
jgi:hypothetical protein